MLVKRQVSETLAFLLKDPQVRLSIQSEKIINVLLASYKQNSDQIFFENVLLSMMHLSYEKKFKPGLYESNIIESLIQHVAGC